MKYNLEYLINRFESGENLKYVYFWGHSKRGNEITKTCFSQWYDSPFKVNGILYKTAEHWMMAKKAELFNNQEIFQKILDSIKPATAKDLGRQVKGFKNHIWEENKIEIVIRGNFHKFSQNKELSTFLKNTKDRILVEASSVDKVWGIGITQDNENIDNPRFWDGQNLLGFALMEVRDILNKIGSARKERSLNLYAFLLQTRCLSFT